MNDPQKDMFFSPSKLNSDSDAESSPSEVKVGND
jgi:hypothetical protein